MNLSMINLKYVAPMTRLEVIIFLIALSFLILYMFYEALICFLNTSAKEAIICFSVALISVFLLFYFVNFKMTDNKPYYAVYIGNMKEDSSIKPKEINESDYKFIKFIKQKAILGEKIKESEMDRIRKIVK